MSKYTNANTVGTKQLIDAYLDPMEYVFWKGRGNKLAYIISSSAKMAPFALIWLLFDGGFIATFLGGFSVAGGGVPGEVLLFIIPFFALHLMPVWIWIGGMFKAAKKWAESAYAITDGRIIIKSPATGFDIRVYTYDKIVTVKLHEGFWDKRLKTADLQFYLVDGTHIDILDIKEAKQVYSQVKQRIEETPCVRELHSENSPISGEKHICKDYNSDFNPYE